MGHTDDALHSPFRSVPTKSHPLKHKTLGTLLQYSPAFLENLSKVLKEGES